MKKIIHTADWHLGCKLYLEDRLDEHRKFLGWLEGILEKERPDLLIVAGDVFDLYTPSNTAQSLYYDFLAHVFKSELARHVVITGGNHDSPSVLASPSKALSCLNVTVVPDEGADQAFAFDCADGGRLAVAALPFLKESFLRNQADAMLSGEQKLSDGFRRHLASVVEQAHGLAPEAPLVISAHCTVSGVSLFSDSREGGAVGGVDAVSSDVFPEAAYVALGHIHVPQAVGGRETIRYSGSVLPMDFGEAEYGKSISVAEIPDDGSAKVRIVPIPVFQELESVKGTRGDIIDRLHQITSVAPMASRWLEVSLTEGEGDFSELRAKVRDELAGTDLKLLCLRDLRPRLYDNGESVYADVDLQITDPLDLARERLREENLTDREVEEYLALVSQALDASRMASTEEDEEVAR